MGFDKICIEDVIGRSDKGRRLSLGASFSSQRSMWGKETGLDETSGPPHAMDNE